MRGNISPIRTAINMKSTYLTLLAAVLGGSLSFAASINGMDSSYSKGYTIYDGNNGDTLNVSSPSVPVHTGSGATPWTMALTISDLGTTSGTDVGLLFTWLRACAVCHGRVLFVIKY